MSKWCLTGTVVLSKGESRFIRGSLLSVTPLPLFKLLKVNLAKPLVFCVVWLREG
jgi:hypothetical protein